MRSIFHIVILSLILVGCSSVSKTSTQDDAKAKKFKLADTKKAGLYVFRDEYLGGAIKMDIYLNNKYFGSTQYKSYLFKELKPGMYNIRGEAENTTSIDVRLKPGEIYYVWQEVRMGVLTARNRIQKVDKNRGQQGVLSGERLVVADNKFD
jgi:hypothetical protein